MDTSGSMRWSTSPRLITGTLVNGGWQPVYTFTIEYPITDSMRVTATHLARFVWHTTPPHYYPPAGGTDVQVSPVISPGVWTVELSRTGGTTAYTAGVYVPEHRLPAATYSAKLFVDAISDTDQAAVVPFNLFSWVAQPLTSSRPAIHAALDSLTATGITRIDQGIAVAHQELITSGHAISGSRRAMVVMSDGRQTGNTQVVFDAAQAAADDGVIIYTIGFGGDADEATLMTVAQIGCGRYYFAPDSQALQEIYQEIAHDLRGRAARSAIIYDILPPGVSLITDRLAPGWSYAPLDGQTVVTRSVTGSLCIAQQNTYTLPVRIHWSPGTSGPVNASGSGITVTTLSSLTTFIPFTNPTVTVGELHLDKQGPLYAQPGQLITYTLRVTNPGPVSVTNTCLGDQVGPEATVVDASHDGQPTVISSTEVWVWDLGTVVPNTVLTRTLTARVNQGVADGTILSNVAGVGVLSAGVCTAPISGQIVVTDTWTTTIVTAGLQAEKTSVDASGPPLYPGDTLIYTVAVQNTGGALDQTNVLITDTVPASTTLVAGSPQSTCGNDVSLVGDTLIARCSQLGPGQVFTLTFQVTVNPGTGGDTIVNQAQVASDQQPNPPQPSPTSDFVSPLVPGLALSKWVDPATAFPPFDDWVTYYYLITNTGTVTLTGIEVQDDRLGPIGSLPDLPVGHIHLFTRSTPLAADVYNVATATAQVVGYPGLVSATDDAYFDLIEGLGLSLDVSVIPDLIPASQTVTYTYRLVNIGNDWLTGGTITDTQYGVIASGLSLAPGASYTRVLTQWIVTTTVNVAYARGTNLLGTSTVTVSDSAKVTVNPSANPGASILYLPLVVKSHP